MARTNNLSNFLTDVADAIRTKRGTSAPIQASAFDTEINNLSAITTNQASGKTLSVQSSNFPFITDKLYGECEQKGLTGKNKYIASQDFSGSWGNSSYWRTDSNKYNDLVVKTRSLDWQGLYKDINVESGKYYTFSLFVKSNVNRPCAIYASGGTATLVPNYYDLTATPSWKRVSFTFYCTSGGTSRFRIENTTSGYDTYICGYQLEEGDEMTSYEIYTGEQPSPDPNPTYPQAINVIKGTNGIIQQTVTGKNLLNIANGTYTPNTSVSTNVKDGVLKVSGTITNTSYSDYFLVLTSISVPAGEYIISIDEALSYKLLLTFYKTSWTDVVLNAGETSKTVTFSEEKTNISIYTELPLGTTLNETIKPMIRLSNIADSTFQPYQTPQTVDINIGQNELCSNKDLSVKDEVVSGKITKRIGKYIVSSSTSSVTINDMKSNGEFMSTVGGTINDKTITFSSSVSSATIYYELATPQEITIPEFTTPHTYDGTTNVSNSANANMSIEYYRIS